MIFDKREIKDSLGIEEVEEILELLGVFHYRENDDKLIIETVCHNNLGEGSNKLYYYTNTKLFNCYSNCGAFDIFDFVQKYFNDFDLNDAVNWVAERRGFSFTNGGFEKKSEEELQKVEYQKQYANEYSRDILDNHLKPAYVKNWVEEGISPEIQLAYEVKYNPRDGAVVFPHYDEQGRLVGIRQRNLAQDMIDRYGKYRPAKIRNVMFSSPLSFYLFGANRNKFALTRTKKAIVFEGEKSVMLYEQYVGKSNNNSVASFGTSFSIHHLKILEAMGVEEIIFAYDRQYHVPNAEQDKEYKALTEKLTRMHKRFSSDTMTVSFMMDFGNLLDYKDSPIDKGLDVFNQLFENRFTLELEEKE